MNLVTCSPRFRKLITDECIELVVDEILSSRVMLQAVLLLRALTSSLNSVAISDCIDALLFEVFCA